MTTIEQVESQIKMCFATMAPQQRCGYSTQYGPLSGWYDISRQCERYAGAGGHLMSNFRTMLKRNVFSSIQSIRSALTELTAA